MTTTVTTPILTAGTWTADTVHSDVAFKVRHMAVGKAKGTFDLKSATLVVDENGAHSVTAEIDAASVDTKQEQRDAHVRSADFLDVENHPTLDFRSTSIVSHKGAEFVVRGDLTIRGVTREVDLKVEFDGVAKSPWGQEVVAFTATTEFDREEFGITWNQALETGGVLVGKKIAVQISAEGVRQAAE